MRKYPEEVCYNEVEMYKTETEYYEDIISDMELRCLANNLNYCNECGVCNKIQTSIIKNNQQNTKRRK